MHARTRISAVVCAVVATLAGAGTLHAADVPGELGPPPDGSEPPPETPPPGTPPPPPIPVPVEPPPASNPNVNDATTGDEPDAGEKMRLLSEGVPADLSRLILDDARAAPPTPDPEAKVQ